MRAGRKVFTLQSLPPCDVEASAGNIGTPHGPALFREMRRMVDAGLTPLQVLRAVTLNGARAMRRQGEAGVIRPGARADIVLRDADPLQAIANARRTVWVIKHGRAHAVDQLLAPAQ